MSKPIKELQLFNDLCAIEETLIERGWCKHDMITSDGRVCVLGAANIIYGIGVDSVQALTVCERAFAVARALKSVMGIVTIFNDDPKTTFEDILAKLREAREALVR